MMGETAVGVCAQCFKVGAAVYEAKEDSDDGYRSYLDCFQVAENDEAFTFPRRPIATVRVERDAGELVPGKMEELDGFNLVDTKTGHIWLRVGTDTYDSYYPCFVFEYRIPGQED